MEMVRNSCSTDGYQLQVIDTNNPVLFVMVLITSLIMKKTDTNNPVRLLSKTITNSTNDRVVRTTMSQEQLGSD